MADEGDTGALKHGRGVAHGALALYPARVQPHLMIRECVHRGMLSLIDSPSTLTVIFVELYES